MARPRLGESDSKRLQMVITEDELGAIDRWQHMRHVASRSEAIRRLVQIGLSADEAIMPIINESLKAAKKIAPLTTEVAGDLQRLKDSGSDGDPQQLWGMLLKMIRSYAQVNALVMDSTDRAFDLLGEIGPMRNTEKFPDLVEAIKKAKDYRDEAIRRVSAFDLYEKGKTEEPQP